MPDYVEGYITDNQGRPINAVTTYLVVNATGQRVTEPFTVSENNYSAWVQGSPYEFSVVFEKKGYQTKKVQISSLQQNPDVVLQTEGNGIIPVITFLFIAAIAFGYMKKKKIGKLGTGDLLPIFILAGGVIGFTVIKKILEQLGIWNSADTKALDNAANDPGSFWNPNYWKSKPASQSYTKPITASTAQQYAKNLYDCFGALNDNEEAAKAIFKALPSQAAASFVVDQFLYLYGQDLLSFLRGGVWPQDRLSDADVNEINRYVNNLPKY